MSAAGLVQKLLPFFHLFVAIGYFVVAAFSRWREYRADAGGAKLAGRGHMISALQALMGTEELINPAEDNGFSSLKISGRRRSSLAMLLSTHPPLEERIKRLERSSIS